MQHRELRRVSQARNVRVLAIVVAYRPELHLLLELIESIRQQVNHCLVVDNGSEGDVRGALARFPSDWLSYQALGQNRGMASAQNIGIQYAKNHVFDFVLLLDQDSRPAADMVERLLDAHGELGTHRTLIAAVGPVFFDSDSPSTTPFVRGHFGWRERLPCTDPNALVRSDHLIASGSLISLDVLAVIGCMEEKLFIDYVDIEWGLRAKSFGYACFGVCAARMEHRLGDGQIRVFGVTLPVRSPLRHYYMVRNAMWLSSRPWISWSWKLILVGRSLGYYAAYSMLARPAFTHWRMMTMGVLHALKGRLGRYDG